MAATTIGLLLLTLIGVAFGQPYLLRYDGIYDKLTLKLVSISAGKTMCYNGIDFYVTNADESITTSTPGLDAETTYRPANANEKLGNVDCCCDVLAYGYSTTIDALYRVSVHFLNRTVQLSLEIAGITEALVHLDCQKGYLYVIGVNSTWIYDLTDPAKPPTVITMAPSLSGVPRCASIYCNSTTNDTYIFVTFDTNTVLTKIHVPSGSTTNLAVNVGSENTYIYCTTIADNMLYGYGQTPTGVAAGMSRSDITFTIPVSNILERTSDILTVTATNTKTEFFLSLTVNGISICINCRDGCMDVNCTSCAGSCGYCSPNNGACACETSNIDQCFYEDATVLEECLGPQIVSDASCIVQYPLAERRAGKAIIVLGISTHSATIDVGRRVKTGRWPISALPDPISVIEGSNISGTYYKGFGADVPNIGRGRRFGVYFADFAQNDAMYRNERLCCLVTENSGFYNTYYTYTKAIGESVTMNAILNKPQYTPALLWLYTNPTTPIPTAVTMCNGMLSCTKNSLTAADEGVYEVYRRLRYKRLWHPIFYLFIRGCSQGKWNYPACDMTCSPACEQGVCDVKTGTCICYAGWTGATCNTACDLGMIGQTCGITCSTHFTGSDNCEYLSICRPGKAGCTCYSGLKPPECKDACEAGKWGPNCALNCTTASCNARTGVAVL